MVLEVPGVYELQGERTDALYWPERRLLELRDGDRSRTLVAREESLSIGTAASVVLEVVHDGPTTTLTLLLPSVNFLGDSSEASVTAVAVFTVARSSIGGPALVDGAVQSYEVELLTGTARQSGTRPHELGCRDWRARLLRLATGDALLVVTGICTVATSGHTVELRRHSPQGINPADLLLDLVVYEPSGGAADVLTDVAVRYEERTEVGFGTVTILPDGPTITVQ
jgi:hypothetical protein